MDAAVMVLPVRPYVQDVANSVFNEEVVPDTHGHDPP